ncbi:type II toxin-antitoxin system death-on-curing family toxin [Companilactobacillus insicii]|uniref:type II toxin-antitoxin system death-on-curing family toxin n=1 Tax=Companilactobacillus insicii TaxID=1732567 RepID=UPI000F77AEB2|nr:type II toxin-antitoxin system death-on-curing family toxin [Companilactobacillus insicii]
MIYLTKEEYIEINKLVLMKSNNMNIGIQYSQGLDLIVEQPRQAVFGRELYPNLWIKASFIIQKLTKKHIFNDGNKRTALLSGLTFLSVNGHILSFTADEGEELILSVTNSTDDEETMVALAEWLKNHANNN